MLFKPRDAFPARGICVCVTSLINQWKCSMLLPGRKSGTRFMLNPAGVLSTVWKCRSDLVFRPHYFTDLQTSRTDGRRCFILPAQIHLHYWWHCWNSPSLSWQNVNPGVILYPKLGYHFPSHTIMLGELLILSSPLFTFQTVLFLHPLPGPYHHTTRSCSERVSNPDSGAGGGHSTKEAKGYSL